jgi:RHH-type proline utilization regulon transcriptional repressor/proline dehydrogenase/delta 1-pyrroline-5-carboxylate dehydrogenase
MLQTESKAVESATPDEAIARQALALAETLLREARADQTDKERSQYQKFAGMVKDPAGKALTIALCDQVFRSHRPARIANQLQYLVKSYGLPDYMAWWEQGALALGSYLGQVVPQIVVPPFTAQLRHETEAVILPGEEEPLRHYLNKRYRTGTRLNLNKLGEAILGEAEAEHRLEANLDLLRREDVEYISVKISSIFSQINLVAFEPTVELIKDRLRLLYRTAMRHTFRRPDGSETPKFVNLDMEEYRDLHLTIAAFCQVLDEPEFLHYRAGLVLQAYLPDSFPLQQELTTWALDRAERGGAAIKIRIVKGANLAMEQAEAALHGWPQAPYHTKAEVDANFKRMVDYGCRPERARVVNLGIASHNLLDLAYGMVLREARGVQPTIEFEMLEGMANHQARTLHRHAGGLLLYAPVVKKDDFHSAIAYLVRRLDENTADENFLRHMFDMEPGSRAWERQKEMFLAAYRSKDSVLAGPQRTQNRATEQRTFNPNAPFANEPDTDWSLAANRVWLNGWLAKWRSVETVSIPLQVGGEFISQDLPGQGVDPSRPEVVAYRYALAAANWVERALEVAVEAHPTWAARSVAERQAALVRVAEALAHQRGNFIGAMMLDGGKTPAEADPEVSEAIDFANYYARALDLGEAVADCRMRPLGVVVVTPPWNFPLAIPAGGLLAALLAGNSVILKPAPEATLVGWELAQTCWSAGIPKEVLQFLPCPDNEIGQQLVTDPRVGGVILTGSKATAQLFQSWQPDMKLLAETSGKNSLIITAMADHDKAIKDLVRSAFGHNGQKCSAASLAILEAEVYDNPAFHRQLRDAAASLRVGPAWDTASLVTPLTQPANPDLYRALTQLEAGETWLLEPRPSEDNPRLWSPGIKLGVKPGSHFHLTECFGPVLGLMRAENLEQAIELANQVEFGLTSGLHSLDSREIVTWREKIQAGNLYINRHITGAVVQRQPFGGWKGSAVGPGAKAGGPNYVLQLGYWTQVTPPQLQAEPAAEVKPVLQRSLDLLIRPEALTAVQVAAGSYAWAWQTHYGLAHDPSQILGEANHFRYRPLPEVILRGEGETDELAICQVALAARTCGTPLTVSLPPEAGRWKSWSEGTGIHLVLEDESALIKRLGQSKSDTRLRATAPVSETVRRAANARGIAVLDEPVLSNGRLELRYYLHEQAVSYTYHRYGNIITPPGGDPARL